jgi:hypothetical protein
VLEGPRNQGELQMAMTSPQTPMNEPVHIAYRPMTDIFHPSTLDDEESGPYIGALVTRDGRRVSLDVSVLLTHPAQWRVR